MSTRKEDDDSPNPDFNRPSPPESREARKARLFQWHYNRGTMEMYYDMFPEDRPPKREPEPEPTPAPKQHGRGR
jgi:hypothetical protein